MFAGIISRFGTTLGLIVFFTFCFSRSDKYFDTFCTLIKKFNHEIFFKKTRDGLTIQTFGSTLQPMNGLQLNSSPISLDQLKQLDEVTIYEILPRPEEVDFEIRLSHLGLLQGESIKILKWAPIFHDPILIEVKGTQMALTKDEARSIMVVTKCLGQSDN